jgi:transcriptional regulator with XRE-family HTH domain
MSSSSLEEKLERWDRMFKEAEQTVDYWLEGAILEFTIGLGRLMDEQGVSRAELARRLGTSRAYVTKLLGGNANFTLETMTKVAMALGSAVHVHVAPRGAIVRWKEVAASEVAARKKRAATRSVTRRSQEKEK